MADGGWVDEIKRGTNEISTTHTHTLFDPNHRWFNVHIVLPTNSPPRIIRDFRELIIYRVSAAIVLNGKTSMCFYYIET